MTTTTGTHLPTGTTPAPGDTLVNVVAHRVERRSATAFVNRWLEVQGAQNYWNGQRFFPTFVTWEIVPTTAPRGFDIVQTTTFI